MRNLLLPIVLCFSVKIFAQSQHTLPQVNTSDAQPLVAHALRLQEALEFLGSSLSVDDAKEIRAIGDRQHNAAQVKRIQEILDPYCLAMVHINPEARVKVMEGPVRPQLVQNGWKTFLVKVHNEAGVTARLEPQSKNAQPILHISTGGHHAKTENHLTAGQVQNGFLEMVMYRSRPMNTNLSGQQLEYCILQIYSRDAGTREAELGFHIGQGSQDIGFRNSIHLLFNISKPVQVIFDVKDESGKPAMASFTITDGVERTLISGNEDDQQTDYRLKRAASEYWTFAKHLRGIYPLPARRLASHDEYPDFFFQPQVYRYNGEHVYLPPGKYNVRFTRGPEYLMQEAELNVPPAKDSMHATFTLKRWINLAEKGWYSADHHVHAAGCSHYETPEQGVLPKDMWRQQMGEDLNVAAVLTWGPGWYHQKQFFTGHSSELSTNQNIMRYDVEVSGFPSSHAGHVVLLNLKEDDYPGTKVVEDWPSWTLPVLQWAKQQKGITGYAHSGWGLEPMENTGQLPNYAVPKMDGIGANEYVVTVTQNAVDFYSAGDTPYPWEMNMWYHTLNCGFRTRISGETDFPCIYDERVGLARSYFKPDGGVNFQQYIHAIQKGRSYVSDGKSHIIDFSVNGVEPGIKESEVHVKADTKLGIKAKVSAWLSEEQDEYSREIASRKEMEQPHWHIERARVGSSRNVKVELIVNGEPVDSTMITADGQWRDVAFVYNAPASSWIALRVKYSSHTNPVFVMVNNKPVAVKKSAEWCMKAVDQCWKMKHQAIRPEERKAAEAAYQKARGVYSSILK